MVAHDFAATSTPQAEVTATEGLQHFCDPWGRSGHWASKQEPAVIPSLTKARMTATLLF